MDKFEKERNSGKQVGNVVDENDPQWEALTKDHEQFVKEGGMLRNPKNKRIFISNLTTVKRLDLERLPLEKPDHDDMGTNPPETAAKKTKKPAKKKATRKKAAKK